jgi:hypothetical protein
MGSCDELLQFNQGKCQTYSARPSALTNHNEEHASDSRLVILDILVRNIHDIVALQLLVKYIHSIVTRQNLIKKKNMQCIIMFTKIHVQFVHKG